jgi:hypothetical protein
MRAVQQKRSSIQPGPAVQVFSDRRQPQPQTLGFRIGVMWLLALRVSRECAECTPLEHQSHFQDYGKVEEPETASQLCAAHHQPACLVCQEVEERACRATTLLPAGPQPPDTAQGIEIGAWQSGLALDLTAGAERRLVFVSHKTKPAPLALT